MSEIVPPSAVNQRRIEEVAVLHPQQLTTYPFGYLAICKAMGIRPIPGTGSKDQITIHTSK